MTCLLHMLLAFTELRTRHASDQKCIARVILICSFTERVNDTGKVRVSSSNTHMHSHDHVKRPVIAGCLLLSDLAVPWSMSQIHHTLINRRS